MPARRGDCLAWLRACKDRLERQAAEAAARQQEKIGAWAEEEGTDGRRKRGCKPKSSAPAVDPDGVANPTDPESGIMKTRRGWIQGENARAVVTPGQIILAADVTTQANDVGQLGALLDQAKAAVALVLGEDDALWFDAGLARLGRVRSPEFPLGLRQRPTEALESAGIRGSQLVSKAASAVGRGVRGRGEGESDTLDYPDLRLLVRDRLDPAESLLDPFADAFPDGMVGHGCSQV